MDFLNFAKCYFSKIMKNDTPRTFTFDENSSFSKNIVLLNFVKKYFPTNYKPHTFLNLILLLDFYYYRTEYYVCIKHYM